MIVPDLNLLVHAYNQDSRSHAAAKAWWESCLNGAGTVGLSWVVILGFLRLTTHPSVMGAPLPPSRACAQVRGWLARPQLILLKPGERHAEILFDLIEELGTAGNLTTDAHIAALAIEHQAEVHTTDADFSRFSGLSWRNPLKP